MAFRQCLWCGSVFEAKNDSQVYCSAACRVGSKRKPKRGYLAEVSVSDLELARLQRASERRRRLLLGDRRYEKEGFEKPVMRVTVVHNREVVVESRGMCGGRYI